MITIAFCVEDDTDEAVYRALLARILEEEVSIASLGIRIRRGGYDQAIRDARTYFERAWGMQIDGALLAVDNDGDPWHDSAHVEAGGVGCRRCQLPLRADAESIVLRPRPSAPPFAALFAVPTQVLETWLLLAKGHPFVGAPEGVGRTSVERRQLKKHLYGVETPHRDLMKQTSLPIIERADLTALATRSASFADFRDQALAMKLARASFSSALASDPS